MIMRVELYAYHKKLDQWLNFAEAGHANLVSLELTWDGRMNKAMKFEGACVYVSEDTKSNKKHYQE